jgi:hypothetical protein
VSAWAWKPRLFFHFKGGLYLLLLDHALHCDTKEPHALYLGIPNLKLWVRPTSQFHDYHESGPKRFQERGPSEDGIREWAGSEKPGTKSLD